MRSCIGAFHSAECTVRPFPTVSLGSPTFTERSRGMSLRVGGNRKRSSWLSAGESLGDGEVVIGAVRNDRLTWLEAELSAIDLDGDHVRLE